MPRRHDGERRAPAETILDTEAAGFFRILQPARWGGYEMKPQVFYDVLIALAEADMSTGWVHGVVEYEFDIAIIHRHAQPYARRSPFLSMPD
jgi:3-hydroxy-9,10-secoandrosta-1,3,5(10)-triene-9,17-dione monooxygenase